MTGPKTEQEADKAERDDDLTEALEESFPGSDPASATQPMTPGRPDRPSGSK